MSGQPIIRDLWATPTRYDKQVAAYGPGNYDYEDRAGELAEERQAERRGDYLTDTERDELADMAADACERDFDGGRWNR